MICDNPPTVPQPSADDSSAHKSDVISYRVMRTALLLTFHISEKGLSHGVLSEDAMIIPKQNLGDATLHDSFVYTKGRPPK